MNQEWSAYLERLKGAARPGVDDCALSSLDDTGLIRVTGEDARDFLQGQLTNDIHQVSPEQGQLSAYCTPKGRMLAIFLVFQRGEALYLQLPRERLDAVLKRLQMFVLRARVKLEDASDDLVVTGLAGGCAEEMQPAPGESSFATLTGEELTRIRIPGTPGRMQLVAPPATMIEQWQRWLDRAVVADADHWPLLNIRAGLPTIYDATAEAFVPQMCNLDLLHGISFTKGCYTGQEVVARMKYLGQLKRRMFIAQVETETCPAPGEALFSPSSKSAQGAGRVVDARPSPDGNGCEALVVVEITGFEAGDMRLGDENGPALALQEPPYGLTPEDTK
ncbi:MAG: folate-binding protein [Gammaproteobacteria bacterium]|nr:MAG: folate-binding protein [Gammaproteobacteria bacterium]